MTIRPWQFKDKIGVITADDRADSPLLDRFFEGYDRAFILPDEREEIDGFKACLALNGQKFAWAPDAFRELVLTLQDDSGTLIGGANFLATRIADEAAAVTVALNYMYVERQFRGRGIARNLINHVTRLAGSIWPDASGPTLVFIEQNDPIARSKADSLADSAHSGTDQIDRLQIWSNLGARALDFDYVQPALSAAKAPDSSLIYAALSAPGPAIDPDILRRHLLNFFGVSVLKGQDPRLEPVASKQLGILDALVERDTKVRLLGMDAALSKLREGNAQQVAKFVELARKCTAETP